MSRGPDLNGYNNGTAGVKEEAPAQGPVLPPAPPRPATIQTLFTPYATTAITRVSTPLGPSSSTSAPETPQAEEDGGQAHCEAGTDPISHPFVHQAIVQQSSLSDFTLSGSHIHRSSSSPALDKVTYPKSHLSHPVKVNPTTLNSSCI